MKFYFLLGLFQLCFSVDNFNWESWKIQQNKTYSSEKEEDYRYSIWKSNIEIISTHNSKNLSYTMGLNQFSDMTPEEFKSRLGFLKSSEYPFTICDGINNQSVKRLTTLKEIVPDVVDWRLNGAVTPIKTQGLCGSCYSFAAVAALEGVYQIATGKLYSLSEQEIIDCSHLEGNNFCFGGLADYSYNYTKKFGLCTEDDYPYMAMGGRCRRKCKPVVNISGCANIWSGDAKVTEMLLKYLVAKYTVAAVVDASLWQSYKSGILDNSSCYFSLNHAVAIVGYNDTVPGQGYWIIKNSEGPQWGENGYIRIRFGTNMCGIALLPSVPVVRVNGVNYPDFS
jgi:C1A family cysteine protease